MTRYQVRPREGVGPIHLGMARTEVERLLGAPACASGAGDGVCSCRYFPLLVDYADGRAAAVGVDRCGGVEAVYRGVDLLHTHAEDLVPLLCAAADMQCDCDDPELAGTYRFPALGLELWRETVYHPKLLKLPRYLAQVGALPENLADEQAQGWTFQQAWVRGDDPRVCFPLERSPFWTDIEPRPQPARPSRPSPEDLARIVAKYRLTQPEETP